MRDFTGKSVDIRVHGYNSPEVQLEISTTTVIIIHFNYAKTATAGREVEPPVWRGVWGGETLGSILFFQWLLPTHKLGAGELLGS